MGRAPFWVQLLPADPRQRLGRGTAMARVRAVGRDVAFAAGAERHSKRNGDQHSPDFAHAYLPSTPQASYRKSAATARGPAKGTGQADR
jgi:hypothetical protein